MSEFVIGGRPYNIATPLGVGAQSQVYAVDGDRVAKVYREPDADRTRRLMLMMEAFNADQFVQPTTNHSICIWPEQVVTDPAGTVIGYAMQRIGGHPMSTLFEHGARLRAFANKDWKFLLTVANNLALTVRVLHDYDIVVGDIAPSNAYVSATGLVSLLDCDSFQFSHGGVFFPCETLTPDYGAPELVVAQSGPRSLATDRFSLAVLVCQLLLCGDHPFQGFPTRELDDDPSPETNIIYGITAVTDPSAVDLPAEAVSCDILPPGVRDLARQAFGSGHTAIDRRPAAEEWYAALDEAWNDVRTCSVRPGHTYSGHLAECPWCARGRAGLFDPFPSLTGPRQRVTQTGPATWPTTAPQPPSQPQSQLQPQSKSRKPILIGALVLVLLIVILIGIVAP